MAPMVSTPSPVAISDSQLQQSHNASIKASPLSHSASLRSISTRLSLMVTKRKTHSGKTPQLTQRLLLQPPASLKKPRKYYSISTPLSSYFRVQCENPSHVPAITLFRESLQFVDIMHETEDSDVIMPLHTQLDSRLYGGRKKDSRLMKIQFSRYTLHVTENSIVIYIRSTQRSK